jgi:hypothetical protein
MNIFLRALRGYGRRAGRALAWLAYRWLIGLLCRGQPSPGDPEQQIHKRIENVVGRGGVVNNKRKSRRLTH